MKICHILWGLTYGGIETMVVNIANRQAAMGHEVHLMIVNDVVDKPMLGLVKPGVHFHNAGRNAGSRNPLPLIRMNFLMWRIRPDVTHFHHVRLHRYVFPSLLKMWCTTHHADYTPLLAPYYAGNPNLFAITEAAAKNIKDSSGVAAKVVYNGVDTRSFKVKNLCYVSGDVFKLAQLGRLDDEVKGQHVLIQAVKILTDRGRRVSVDLIGDGASRDRITAMIDRLGLTEEVNLKGAVRQELIRECLADYDALVQPSFVEGFGLAIVEGMSAGVPVIVSDIPTQLEVIANGRYGLKFKCGDSEDLADVISGMIDSYSLRIAKDAKVYVEREFDVKTTASHYLAEYARL